MNKMLTQEEIFDTIDKIAQKRDMDSGDIQALKASIQHTVSKK